MNVVDTTNEYSLPRAVSRRAVYSWLSNKGNAPILFVLYTYTFILIIPPIRDIIAFCAVRLHLYRSSNSSRLTVTIIIAQHLVVN